MPFVRESARIADVKSVVVDSSNKEEHKKENESNKKVKPKIKMILKLTIA